MLSRRQAVPLAIASVAGSGILFLPSAVYVEAGSNSLLVWLLATAVCFPMLLMFEDMVRANPGGDGIEAFIRAGLGDAFGRCVPLMFMAIVIVGLPAGALVVGRYVARALGAGEPAVIAGAAGVMLTAVAANLAGARANARVQNAGSWALIGMAVVLLTGTVIGGTSAGASMAPDGGHPEVLLPGLVLGFWAFTGFENLTFLSREFRRPARDFLPVTVIALGVYGLLTALLTVAIALRVPRRNVDDVVGLLQVANTLEPRHLMIAAVTVIAFATMTINGTAWVWGVSRLTAAAAAGSRILPGALAVTGQRAVPRRAVLLLAALSALMFALLVVIPDILVDAVATGSAIFIVLYVLSIVSYVRVRGLTSRSLANLLLLLVFLASLAAEGWRSVYGLAVLTVALGLQLVPRRST